MGTSQNQQNIPDRCQPTFHSNVISPILSNVSSSVDDNTSSSDLPDSQEYFWSLSSSPSSRSRSLACPSPPLSVPSPMSNPLTPRTGCQVASSSKSSAVYSVPHAADGGNFSIVSSASQARRVSFPPVALELQDAVGAAASEESLIHVCGTSVCANISSCSPPLTHSCSASCSSPVKHSRSSTLRRMPSTSPSERSRASASRTGKHRKALSFLSRLLRTQCCGCYSSWSRELRWQRFTMSLQGVDWRQIFCESSFPKLISPLVLFFLRLGVCLILVALFVCQFVDPLLWETGLQGNRWGFFVYFTNWSVTSTLIYFILVCVTSIAGLSSLLVERGNCTAYDPEANRKPRIVQKQIGICASRNKG
eukprot:GHVT01047682.1.p1 GENE.GHVT01047682.1~~GHVT01047682.1.p1  ORF type:complete len:364 (+),score=30.50 GHVT01047682.1:1267-2358(+)